MGVSYHIVTTNNVPSSVLNDSPSIGIQYTSDICSGKQIRRDVNKPSYISVFRSRFGRKTHWSRGESGKISQIIQINILAEPSLYKRKPKIRKSHEKVLKGCKETLKTQIFGIMFVTCFR